MVGRTPAEAVHHYLELLRPVVACVSDAVINVAGGYHPSEQPHSLLLNNGMPVRLTAGALIRVFQRYRLVAGVNPSAPWKAAIVAYSYALDAEDGPEIFSYQWHPSGPSPVGYPHLHIGAGAAVGNTAVDTQAWSGSHKYVTVLRGRRRPCYDWRMARETLTPSEIARLLVSQRRVMDHTCPMCGATFRGRVGARYCSNRCRQAAKRERQRSEAAKG